VFLKKSTFLFGHILNKNKKSPRCGDPVRGGIKMKNKYLEVEIFPFSILPENNPGFAVRPLNKEYRPETEKTSLFKKISLFGLRLGLMFLFAFFPLLSAGESFSEEIIKLTNLERAEMSLPALSFNPTLEKAALAKTQDMLDNQYFSHTSPEGLKAWDFILAQNYDYAFAGENLAINFSSPAKAFAAWLVSPTHRQNILDKDFKEIGVSVTEGIINGQQTSVIAEFFGTEK